MLRHIISVSLASLAMTACASLIPIKANAASIKLIPVAPPGPTTLQRNPGDSLMFLLLFEGAAFRYPIEIQGYSVDYDHTELSLVEVLNPVGLNSRLTDTKILARYIFEVLEPVVKDGEGDISATANYRIPQGYFIPESFGSTSTGPVHDVEPVPEPLTIFGTATALGCGALFKRKSSKKTVS
jgi:hypothetical protein